jgi:uncharacterized protein (TIGR00255 family)
MKSMTGYGRGECAQNGFKITIEASSVNRKQSELSIQFPRELEPLEPQARDEINRHVSRGRVTVRVSLHTTDSQQIPKVRINENLAREYTRELRRLGKELHLAGDVTLELLARAPGVLETEDAAPEAEAFWPAVEKALKQSFAALVKMREREGAHLAKDLTNRMGTMKKAASRVEKLAPQVQKRYHEQLLARVQQAETQIEPQRLAQEIVLFADRSDISEELTRLKSHFQQFQDCLKSSEPVGRTLDFLCQEMNREVNTLGAKANDSSISREVVLLKTELEKFREQVQNVE